MVSHRKYVKKINEDGLNRMAGEMKTYVSKTFQKNGEKQVADDSEMMKMINAKEDAQRWEHILKLKVGAPVFLNKNARPLCGLTRYMFGVTLTLELEPRRVYFSQR